MHGLNRSRHRIQALKIRVAFAFHHFGSFSRMAFFMAFVSARYSLAFLASAFAFRCATIARAQPGPQAFCSGRSGVNNSRQNRFPHFFGRGFFGLFCCREGFVELFFFPVIIAVHHSTIRANIPIADQPFTTPPHRRQTPGRVHAKSSSWFTQRSISSRVFPVAILARP